MTKAEHVWNIIYIHMHSNFIFYIGNNAIERYRHVEIVFYREKEREKNDMTVRWQ